MIQELRILDKETLFDTEVHYVIPRYQRAYAWEDKEIVQLIDDINDSTRDYYIGSLVVAKVKGKVETYEVVDGQQRLTTLYLLLHYLVSCGGLEGEVGETLSFDCRPNSNYTLTHIQGLLLDRNSLADNEDRLEQSIMNGLKVIDQKFTTGDAIDVADFIDRLKSVILYRIEVPEHTDLNRYFEIMNTRGEQLEQHDILKAQLMGYLSNRCEQEFFARVWDACSDMTGYVQMHFAKEEREKIFGSGWNNEPSDDWNDYKVCLAMEQGEDHKVSIMSIIEPSFEVEVSDRMLEGDKTKIRFESIIGFPHFLLHVLRVFLSVESISMDEEKVLGSLLDDKRLLNDFNEVISYGRMGGKRIKDNKGEFARRFIMFLLRSRFLFDQFIIKRESIGDDQDGRWSLKELCTSGAWSAKKPYYANTRLRYENEWEKTYAPRNKECLMIQSALRVSYTSPKVMHWITELLVWLFNNNETERYKLTDEAERIAAEAVKENFLDLGNYELGVQTPHVVFNYLDYLLWKEDKERYEDFVFEFRNSVEHWYPQHPPKDTIEIWDRVDTFGNLCIISRSVNSKFSNLPPESKMQTFERMVQRSSLKLRIMGNIIGNIIKKGGGNQDWVKHACQEHEEEMLELLKKRTEELLG